MSKLFIKETWVNDTENYQCGSSDWYETFAENTKDLLKSLRKEYGRPSKMYVEDKNGKSKQVGWVFTKSQKYEDIGEKYTQSTWVEVSKTMPVKVCHIENIEVPF